MSSFKKTGSHSLPKSPHSSEQSEATANQFEQTQNHSTQEGITGQQTSQSVLESVEGQDTSTDGTAESTTEVAAAARQPGELKSAAAAAAAVIAVAGSAMMVHGAANLELMRLCEMEIRDAPQPSVEATQFLQWIKNTQAICNRTIEKVLGLERTVQIMTMIVAIAGVSRTIETVYSSLRIVGEKIEYGEFAIPDGELLCANTAQEVQAARLLRILNRSGERLIALTARYIGANELLELIQILGSEVCLELRRLLPFSRLTEIARLAGDELITDIVTQIAALVASSEDESVVAVGTERSKESPQPVAVTVQLAQPPGSSAESQRSQATDPTALAIERGDDAPGDGLQTTQPPEIVHSNVSGNDSSPSYLEFLSQMLADCVIANEDLEHRQNSSNASDEDMSGLKE